MSGESESEPTWLALPPASAEEAEAGGIKRSFSTDEYDEEDDKSKIRRLESELTDAKTELVFLTGVLNSMDSTGAATTETKTVAAAASCAFVDCGCSFPNSWTLVKHIREFHFDNLSCTECDAKFHDPWSKRRHMQKKHAQEQQTNDVLTLAIDESHIFPNDDEVATVATADELE